MYVNHVDMYMILSSVIQITASHQEQRLMIFQKTGYVQSVEWGKKYL